METREIRERLWRVRKDHTWIDAQIETGADGSASVRFSYDGERLLSRQFPRRDLAIGEAERTLHDLQRTPGTVGAHVHPQSSPTQLRSYTDMCCIR